MPLWYQASQGVTKMLLGAGNRLFLGTGDGRVVELDAATGHPLWSTALGFGEAITGLTLARSGLLYAAHGERISVVRTDSLGLLPSAWPKAQRDTANSGHACSGCASCGDDPDCAVGVCALDETCVECRSDDACQGQVCAPDRRCRACVEDVDCAVGQSCTTQGECVE